MPAAAYLEQALAAARLSFGEGFHRIEQMSVQDALFLTDAEVRVVHVVLTPESSAERGFQVFSQPARSRQTKSGSTAEPIAAGGSEDPHQQTELPWTLHAAGRLRLSPESKPTNESSKARVDFDEVRGRAIDFKTHDEFYESMREIGMTYGPRFRVLHNLCRSDYDGTAEVILPGSVCEEMSSYCLHPALGDACFQMMAATVPFELDGAHSPYSYLPTRIHSVRWYAPLTTKLFGYARRTSDDGRPSPDSVTGDVQLFDEAGRVLVELSGLTVTRVRTAAREDAFRNTENWLYNIDWIESRKLKDAEAGPAAGTDGSRLPNEDGHVVSLILGKEGGVALALVSELQERDGSCVLVTPGDPSDQLEIGSNDFASRGGVARIRPTAPDDCQRLLDELSRSTPINSDGSTVQTRSRRLRVVHLWSLDVASPHCTGSTTLDGATNRVSLSTLTWIRQLSRGTHFDDVEVWLVTKSAQAVTEGDDVSGVLQSPLWGLGRVATLEHPELHCRLIDLDDSQTHQNCARHLIHEFDAANHENQIAWRGDLRYVPRLRRSTSQTDKPQDHESHQPLTEEPYRLRLGKAGTFDGLWFERQSRPEPFSGQVVVEVRAAGLNFSDVLKAMGLYPGLSDEIPPLGIECAGVVSAVGPEVTRFGVGDEVLGIAPYSLASYAVTVEEALIHKPAGVTHAEAATIPITFLTAYYALRRLADIQPGERVLVHAAAGGVGQAATQICQHLGAEVFATAGSDEKRSFLQSQGIAHVMNSRTLDFADHIKKITEHRGVDAVLNSLPGDVVTKSLECLGAYGRFLEIGKIDIYQNRMIGLRPFQDNLSYFAIDLDRMLRQRPEFVRGIFQEIIQLFEQRIYLPLPLTQFAMRDVVDAFRFMSQRKNIGKIVIEVNPPADFPEKPADAEKEYKGNSLCRSDGTYLISGGIGALGLCVAEFLSRHEAGNIVLLSRSEPSDHIFWRLEQIRDTGAMSSRSRRTSLTLSLWTKSWRLFVRIFPLCAELSTRQVSWPMVCCSIWTTSNSTELCSQNLQGPGIFMQPRRIVSSISLYCSRQLQVFWVRQGRETTQRAMRF